MKKLIDLSCWAAAFAMGVVFVGYISFIGG